MGIAAVLFDLDGTLLPMDQDEFTRGYFGLLAQKMAPYGYDAKALVDGIWAGTAAMVKNDGSRTNEEVFWDCFARRFGEEALAQRPVFDGFYANEFQGAKRFCPINPQAAQAVREIKGAGCRVALATNPIFPAVGTRSRVRWTGLEPEDFEFCTTYEDCHWCKPSLGYYREVLDRLGLTAGECLMVGNDVGEDMVARELGMEVFLLADCLIDREGKGVDAYPHGGFPELMAFWADRRRAGRPGRWRQGRWV